MALIERSFEFDTPVILKGFLGNMRISGKGTCYSDDPQGLFMDYELSSVMWEGKDLVQLCDWLGGSRKGRGSGLKNLSIHEPVMAHLHFVFQDILKEAA